MAPVFPETIRNDEIKLGVYNQEDQKRTREDNTANLAREPLNPPSPSRSAAPAAMLTCIPVSV